MQEFGTDEFSNSDIVQDLDRLLSLRSGDSASSLCMYSRAFSGHVNIYVLHVAQVDLKHAMCSLAALIKYLDVRQLFCCQLH